MVYHRNSKGTLWATSETFDLVKRGRPGKWDIITDNYVPAFLADFKKLGMGPPTFRTMYYNLFSIGVYPNTKSSANSLNRAVTKARESGKLPIDCLVDDSRRVVGGFYDDPQYTNPQNYLNGLIYKISNFPQVWKKTIPRWTGQKKHVEIWTEKNALVRNFQYILGDREVNIVPIKGYSGPAFLSHVLKPLYILKSKYEKEIFVFYFGDMDPSGENITETVKKKLGNPYYPLTLDDINFRHVALTEGQVNEYGLPKDPDPKTLEKLENDSRRHKFRENHNGQLFQVELDALVALRPDVFRQLVLRSIDPLFDENIHKDVIEQYSNEQLSNMAWKSTREKYFGYKSGASF